MRFGPIIVGCGIALVLACAIWFLQKPRWKPIQQILPDGTVVRIETVTYGDDHRYSQNPLKDKILRVLPRPLKSLIQTPAGARMTTAPNTLVFWLTLDSTLARSTNIFIPQQNRFWAQDDHGCLFLSSHWLTSGSVGSNIIGVAFESFPRNQRKFSLGGGSTAGLVFLITNVPNSFFTRGKSWKSQPLPQKLTNNNLLVETSAARHG